MAGNGANLPCYPGNPAIRSSLRCALCCGKGCITRSSGCFPRWEYRCSPCAGLPWAGYRWIRHFYLESPGNSRLTSWKRCAPRSLWSFLSRKTEELQRNLCVSQRVYVIFLGNRCKTLAEGIRLWYNKKAIDFYFQDLFSGWKLVNLPNIFLKGLGINSLSLRAAICYHMYRKSSATNWKCKRLATKCRR